MEHLAFVIWMILYPLVSSTCDYLTYLKGKRFSKDIEGMAALTSFAFYIFVGFLLF